MTQKVLLDANLLISIFDEAGSTSTEERAKAREKLSYLLQDDQVALAITPLIRYEVLRGIEWSQDQRYQALKESIEGFDEFDITRDVSELAANLYRFDAEKARNSSTLRNLEKRKFDVFHFSSAVCYDLEIASRDTDIAKLRELYDAYISNDIEHESL